MFFLKKWTIPGLFFIYFRLLSETMQILQQINLKNVHPGTGAGTQTHDLLIMSLFFTPLDQGVR